MAIASDRNLLLGLLAVQMDFVSADQLVAGMGRWVLAKDRPLEDHLAESGVISADSAKLLSALVDKHIERHGGRAEQSLAALRGAEPMTQALSSLGDADVQRSLGHATTPHHGETPTIGDRHATLAVPKSRGDDASERYQVLRPLASGGLGKVSIARDQELHREVALKELLDRHADHPDSRARFLQEAEITGGLEHPGIVPIYGLGQYADGRPFYAMRFIRGDSLARAIEQFHRLASADWSEAEDQLRLRRLLGKMIDVCNAVEYAHSRGVLHRDLKPGNIMLGAYGETLVVDWGLAKPFGKVEATAPRSPLETLDYRAEGPLTPHSGSGSAPTQMGSAVGTPAFMSPEQAAGRLDELGPASDVYSLGATLYVLLAGKPPQEDDDLGVVLSRVERNEFATPRSVKPYAPRGLEAICLKAMARRPTDRYASARALGEDIEAWLADEPVSALPESPLMRGRRWVKRHRGLVGGAVAVLLVAAAASTFGVVFLTAANQREREARDEAVAARNEAEKSRSEAERQSSLNAELVGLARKSLDRYEQLSKSPQLSRFGMEPLRRDLQEAAIDFYDTIARQSGEGDVQQLDKARALARLGATYAQLRQVDLATDRFQKSLDLFLGLEKDRPADAVARRGAAIAFLNLGELLVDGQQAREAAEPLAEARRRLEELRKEKDSELDDSTILAFGWSLEGERLRQLGQMEDAADVLRRGIVILREANARKLSDDEQLDVQFRLGRALNQLATLESQALWRFDAARQTFAESEQLLEQLADRWPKNTDVALSLVQVLRNSGFLAARENLIDEARSRYDRAIERMRAVEEAAPDVPSYRSEMAELLASSGELHHPISPVPPTDAEIAQLEEAVAIGRRLVEQYPQQAEFRKSLVRHLSSLGAAYHRQGRDEDARKTYVAALQDLSKFVETSGASVDTLFTLATMQATLGQQIAESGELEAGIKILDQSEERLKQLIEMAPKFGEAQLSLLNAYTTRSNLREDQGLLATAIADLDRAIAQAASMQKVVDVPWLKSGTESMAALAKTLRWGYLTQIRNAALHRLADDGRYDHLASEAALFATLTGEASDRYVAGLALAHGVAVVAQDQELPGERRDALAESLGAAAVSQLEACWKGGYLRKSPSWFSAAPSLKTLRDNADWKSLEGRADYQKLLKSVAEGPQK
jgi:serine/threonine-protein kinase